MDTMTEMEMKARQRVKAAKYDYDYVLALSKILPLLTCKPFQYGGKGPVHYDITYRGLHIQSRQMQEYLAPGL